MRVKKLIFSTFLSISVFWQLTAQNSVLNPGCPKILGIAHVGYYSPDFEKEKQYYGEYLGFKSLPSRINKEGVEDMIKFRIGNLQSVELFIEKKPESRRFYHYAVLVDNSEQMRQYLASKNVKVPKDSVKNFQNYFAYDFNNMICEIVDIRRYGRSEKDSASQGIATHIDGVSFVVPDMNKAKSFYINVLGCKELSDKKQNNIHVAKLQLQNSPDYLQLVEYLNKDEVQDYIFYDYYSMVTTSFKSAEAQIKHKKLSDGSKIEVGKPREKTSGQIDFYGINGNRIIVHNR